MSQWSIPIGPVRRQGVVRVDHREESDLPGDVGTLESIRITSPVEALVMMADQLEDGPECRERSADLFADDRMVDHSQELVLSQRSRLVQKRFRHGDFSDVMEQSGGADALRFILIESEVGGETVPQIGYTLRVAARVLVLCLECQGKGADDVLCLLEIGPVIGQSEQRADAGRELEAVNGVGEEVVGAGDDRLLSRLLALFRGQDDDRDEFELRLAAYAIDQCQPVHAGHVQIDEDQVHALPMENLESLVAAGSVQELESLSGQMRIEEPSVALLIIHVENSGMGYGFLEPVSFSGRFDRLVFQSA